MRYEWGLDFNCGPGDGTLDQFCQHPKIFKMKESLLTFTVSNNINNNFFVCAAAIFGSCESINQSIKRMFCFGNFRIYNYM